MNDSYGSSGREALVFPHKSALYKSLSKSQATVEGIEPNLCYNMYMCMSIDVKLCTHKCISYNNKYTCTTRRNNA